MSLRPHAFAAIARRMNLRHLRHRPLRTALTVAGIGAGVALVFSISVINATLLASFRSSIRTVAGSAELEVAGRHATGLPQRTAGDIAELRGIEAAVPALRATTRLAHRGSSERALVLGVTPAFQTLLPDDAGPLTPVDVELGSGIDLGGMLLARAVADDLRLDIGDRVAVDTPRGPRSVEVVGLISGGTLEIVNGGRVGVMLLPVAQELFLKADRLDSIYVTVEPTASLDEAEDRIEALVGPSAVVGPPGERGRGLERIFGALGTLISMAGTVALFVALFVVYNTMSMALAERRREISMAVALGATRGQLFAAFLAEAVVVGLVASAIGIAAGYALAHVLVERAVEAYRFLPVAGAGPLVVDAGRVATAFAGGLVVSVVGAFVPARRVLRVAPIEALRPEASYEWARTHLDARAARRAGLILGPAGIAVAAALYAGYVFGPDRRWLVTVALVFGLGGVTLLLPRIVPIGVAALRPILIRTTGAVGRLSADALKANAGRTTFTVAALVLTLGIVIGVGSALRSYELQVKNTAGALIGAPIYVTAESYSGVTSDQPMPLSFRRALQRIEGVRFVYPLRFALITLEGEQALIYAIDVKDVLEAGATSVMSTVTTDPEGFVEGLERGEIAVSRFLAERRGLEVGERLAIPAPGGARSFRVAAVFDDLVSFGSLYMGHDTYRALWRDRTADEFGVLPEDGVPPDDLIPRLERVVEQRGVSALVLRKEELIGRILDIVAGTFALGRGIQLAALVVALIVIANTMFTAVFERRWEMGLQRAVGMSGRQIAGSVLLEAGAIGILGGIGGAILGVATGLLMTRSMELQFAWRIAFRLPVAMIVLSIVAGAAVAAAAGFLPSRLAVRTRIIEALRYE